MSNGEIDRVKIFAKLPRDERDFLEELPPDALVVAWLILSHHKLPSEHRDKKHIQKDWQGECASSMEEVLEFVTRSWGYENRYDENEFQQYVSKCYTFSRGILESASRWIKLLKRYAIRLESQLGYLEEALQNGSIRSVLHHSRLALMLGDHNYSSKAADSTFRSETDLFANTDPNTGRFKQKLDEHLCGVYAEAMRVAQYLPVLQDAMPKVEDSRMLRKPSPAAFVWQDHAVSKIRKSQKTDQKRRGMFAVNMASTGKGKTIANAKIMQALSSDRKSFRYNLALGLRTLTLQTGDEYRQRIGLSREEMAVLIGSSAVMQLYKEDHLSVENVEEHAGSESVQNLMEMQIDYEGEEFIDQEILRTLFKKEKERQLFFAPVLVSTIDHLMGAVTSKKGGHHILPALRLLSSDLVIDEIDDFTGSDLVAIGRLVHLAGMLGRGVMLSSATIPPDLAEGYYHAYCEGWKLFALSDESAVYEILSLWIDEFKTEATYLESNESIETYRKKHHHFVEARCKKLAELVPQRKARIALCQQQIETNEEERIKRDRYFDIIAKGIETMHRVHYTIDPLSGKKISFGVVRMANITPCTTLSRYLLEKGVEGTDIRILPYHSNQVLLLRHFQEKHLDEVLKRKENQGEMPKAFENEIIRHHIDEAETDSVTFVLVATPVEEVGRDHDFDWAIVEPSSYRSIIQLAGRVLRHRFIEPQTANVLLQQYNYKAFMDGDKPGRAYFVHPGFEILNPPLVTHDLVRLIDTEAVAKRLDAVPRIIKNEPLEPTKKLADLEHYVTYKFLSDYVAKGADSFEGYLKESWYLTAHPLYLHPFREGKEETKAVLVYDEEQDRTYFAQIDRHGNIIDRDDYFGFERIDESQIKQRLWLDRDYQTILQEYAEMHGLDIRSVCRRFGEISFVRYDENDRFAYSDNFGLFKKERK